MLDDRLSIAVGQESKVPDLHKSAGQHMQEKPPDELDGIQGRLFDLIVVVRIAPAKPHVAIVQPQEPAIGNRHAVRVPRQTKGENPDVRLIDFGMVRRSSADLVSRCK